MKGSVDTTNTSIIGLLVYTPGTWRNALLRINSFESTMDGKKSYRTGYTVFGNLFFVDQNLSKKLPLSLICSSHCPLKLPHFAGSFLDFWQYNCLTSNDGLGGCWIPHWQNSAFAGKLSSIEPKFCSQAWEYHLKALAYRWQHKSPKILKTNHQLRASSLGWRLEPQCDSVLKAKTVKPTFLSIHTSCKSHANTYHTLTRPYFFPRSLVALRSSATTSLTLLECAVSGEPLSTNYFNHYRKDKICTHW